MNGVTYTFTNANSRETYFTLHNVKAAQKMSDGAGVKVGIIDWLFAPDEHPGLYAGVVNLTGVSEQLTQSGHGLWMATTLREIAPKCEIYAICAVDYSDNAKRVALLESAIDWALENGIDVLTYSHAAFSGSERTRAYGAIEKAVRGGITTTFIHCDSLHNIWPFGCFPFVQPGGEAHSRTPDVNVLHFDYNTLMTNTQDRYNAIITAGQSIQSGDDIPYFSFSSMSPVLGGFVALMKSLDKTLDSDKCREVLIKTSYAITKNGKNWYDINPCGRVADIAKALEEIKCHK